MIPGYFKNLCVDSIKISQIIYLLIRYIFLIVWLLFYIFQGMFLIIFVQKL